MSAIQERLHAENSSYKIFQAEISAQELWFIFSKGTKPAGSAK